MLVGVVLLAIVSAGTFVYLKSNQTADEQPVTYDNSKDNVGGAVAETSEQQEGSQAAAPQPGQYVEYSEELAASTAGTKLLFFHAPWCPQCRELDASIVSGLIPANATIFKVDYDSNQALRQKYGVTIQTTIVKIDNQGNKIASYVAYDEPTLTALKNALLP